MRANIKYKATGELQPNGKREVFFEANGVPRVLEVADTKEGGDSFKKAVREKADLATLGSVGAPMAGSIIEVRACYSGAFSDSSQRLDSVDSA